MPATATTSRSVLRQAISGQRRQVTLASVLAAGHQGGEALVPVIIGVVIDQAVDGGSAGTLVFWLAVLALVFAGLSYSYRFAARAAEGASLRAAHDLRIAISRRVLHPGGGAENGKLAGELVNIGTSDAQRVGVVNAALPFGIAALAGVLVSAIALLRISLPLGLLVLLGTPPLLYLAHLIGKPLERRSEAEQERSAHASGVATDLVSGLRVLKGIGAEPAAVARYRDTSQNSLKATLRAARAKAWHDGAVLALTGVFIAIVALVGGHLAASGSISVGDLVAAVGLAQFLLTPFLIFSWVNGELAQGRASASRVADLLTTPAAVEPGGGELPSPATGNVRLTEVSYGSLRGVNLDIPAGQLIGVVAADPAAATDLLDCLGRAGDPAEGSVHVDGVDLSTVDPERVREVVLVAAHDADLFEGTLAENVGGGSPDEALAASAADEVAAALPDGTRTAVTERGRSLSGGQRQRVALARALAADAPVLVVHDPTTAVDTVTEAKIATGLARLRRGRTTILVTTSPALLAVADRVVVLDGGRITGEGGHAELVRDRADYRAAVLS
ncbi:ABC transporter ATP-binding protein [Amycolatopsis sp. NPDC102389]|uniref:ABC transporter ATP-binding protein n=1 Tax=Amycolatopsis sp. NPDC102389 TaxID=3363941 RepID=UPI003820AD92